jgi:steroid 5-alpha reductase family enzyme
VALAPLLFAVLAGMALVMTAAWLTQRALGNSGWIDVFWTFGTGSAGVLAALWPGPGLPARRELAAGLMALWALRLGGYILRRVAASPHEDARYVRFKQDWGAHYQARIFWLTLPQALVTTVICVSIAIAVRRATPVLDLRDLLAAIVLAIAIGGESLADGQLSRFKASKPAKGAVNDVGLWGWSRHPNYFFEWFGWLAWPVMALRPEAPLTWLTVVAPAAMYVVLRFITGVPPLEASMLASRGEAFRDYQRRTSVFIPLPPKGA